MGVSDIIMTEHSKQVECINCDAVYKIKTDSLSESHYIISYCSFCGAEVELEEELQTDFLDEFGEVVEDW
jgi:transcription elongation factor Elf1|tara:strand:- start:314 stop:523 length:210 start_codon:yes stop_codon:yes gene_type:complete